MARFGSWSVAALAVATTALMPREAGRSDGPVPSPAAAAIETGAVVVAASPAAPSEPERQSPAPSTPPAASMPAPAAVPRPVALAQAGAADGAPDGSAVATDRGGEAPEAVPRAAQIEPMVEPVKRVVPKTPAAEEPRTPRKEAAAKKPRSTGAKVVPSKPNCDAGYKPDSSGKRCIRVAASEPQSKKKKR